jgi:hypothetical protein
MNPVDRGMRAVLLPYPEACGGVQYTDPAHGRKVCERWAASLVLWP